MSVHFYNTFIVHFTVHFYNTFIVEKFPQLLYYGNTIPTILSICHNKTINIKTPDKNSRNLGRFGYIMALAAILFFRMSLKIITKDFLRVNIT